MASPACENKLNLCISDENHDLHEKLNSEGWGGDGGESI